MSSLPQGAETVEEEAPRPAPVARSLPLHGVLLTLIRRELWEHRVLWIAPLVVSALILLSAIPSQPGMMHVNFTFKGGQSLDGLMAGLPQRLPQALMGIGHWALTVPLYGVLVLMLTFYLADCLYAERRDRSILFWKSLPVSDLATVGSKALLGGLLIPCGVYLLAALTDLLFFGIWYLRASLGAASPDLLPWSGVTWLKVQGLLGIGLVMSILWYAPLGAYLLLVSAWARRNAFLWASLPPLLAPIVERLAFGTSHLWDLLNYRTFGLIQLPPVREAGQSATLSLPGFSLVSPAEMFDALSIGRLLIQRDVWLGLVVAAALLYLAARVRRHRDDS